MAERNSMTVAELVAKVRDGRLECRRTSSPSSSGTGRLRLMTQARFLLPIVQPSRGRPPRYEHPRWAHGHRPLVR